MKNLFKKADKKSKIAEFSVKTGKLNEKELKQVGGGGSTLPTNANPIINYNASKSNTGS